MRPLRRDFCQNDVLFNIEFLERKGDSNQVQEQLSSEESFKDDLDEQGQSCHNHLESVNLRVSNVHNFSKLLDKNASQAEKSKNKKADEKELVNLPIYDDEESSQSENMSEQIES
jgi:hypothetical protein